MMYAAREGIGHTSSPGKARGTDPVAMTMFFALIVWEEPSSEVTPTWLGPIMVPCPCTLVT